MAENTLKELNVFPQENKITEFLPLDPKIIQKENLSYVRND